MAATIFEFWASLETNFVRKTCTLEGETSASGLSYYTVFISLNKKKYMFSGVTFSFKENDKTFKFQTIFFLFYIFFNLLSLIISFKDLFRQNTLSSSVE